MISTHEWDVIFADHDSRPGDFNKNVALLITIIGENVAACGDDLGTTAI